jgi:NAD(P)-dependent dehydrogenase (short-subunit alcohol dehydrogenase family)
LITGVNVNGLGAGAAQALAREQPKRLILTARTPAKAQAVVDLLETQNSNAETTYSVVQLDLSSSASVRRGAAQIQELVQSIDIIINNAGVMAIPERSFSVDGVEMHLATNFLGHFLLAKLLHPQLAAAAHGSRVINITSAGFVLTGFRFADYNFDGDKRLPVEERVNVPVAEMMGFSGLDPQTGYMPFLAYAQANVANMLFTKKLSELYADTGIMSFSAAPGVVVTDLQRHLPEDFRNPNMFYKTPSQGVASFLVAALDPALAKHAGAYINDCQIEQTAENVESPVLATKLWDLAESLVDGPCAAHGETGVAAA